MTSESSLQIRISSQNSKISHLEEVAAHRDHLRDELLGLHEGVERRNGELESLVAVVDALKSSLANASHQMLKDRTLAPRTTDLERIVFSNKIIRTGIMPEIRSAFGIPKSPKTGGRPPLPQRSSTMPRPPTNSDKADGATTRLRRAMSHSRTSSSPTDQLKATKRRVKSSDATSSPRFVSDQRNPAGLSQSDRVATNPFESAVSQAVSHSPSFSSSSLSSVSSAASSVDFESSVNWATSTHSGGNHRDASTHPSSGSGGHRRAASTHVSHDGHRVASTHSSPNGRRATSTNSHSRSSSQTFSTSQSRLPKRRSADVYSPTARNPFTKRRSSDDFYNMNSHDSSGDSSLSVRSNKDNVAESPNDRRDSLEQELEDFPPGATPPSASGADELLGAIRRQFCDLLMQNARLRVKLNSVVQRVIVADSGARIGKH